MRLLLGLMFLLLASACASVDNPLPTGPLLFSGEAQVGTEPPFPIHVELRHSEGRVSGTFATEDMQFQFAGAQRGAFIEGELSADGVNGTASVRLAGRDATGRFAVAGQAGTLSLRKTERKANAYLRPAQNIQLTTAQWSEDLDELASILATRHGGPFDYVSRREFFRQVAQARRSLPNRTGIQNAIAFRKLGALIGDGHTSVAFVRGRPVYPVEMFWFEDGLRVIAVAPEHRDLLGSKLASVNGVPTGQLLDRLKAYIGQAETPWGYRNSAPHLLYRADLLNDLGIVEGDRASFTFETTAGARVVELPAAPERADLVRFGRGHPLWERKPDEGFWHERWEDDTVYLNWRSYEDLDARSEALLAELERNRPKRLLIDLRDNGGGDFNVGRRFIERIRSRPWLNQSTVLYVLIGRGVFSAAMTNSVDFRKLTNATLIGEPPGARPNGWQENRSFFLPNSGLRTSVSTKNYQFLPGENALRPDVVVPPVLDDWQAERDAAVRHIISRRVD